MNTVPKLLYSIERTVHYLLLKEDIGSLALFATNSEQKKKDAIDTFNQWKSQKQVKVESIDDVV